MSSAVAVLCNRRAQAAITSTSGDRSDGHQVPWVRRARGRRQGAPTDGHRQPLLIRQTVPSSHRADAYCRVKLIVTVTRTGTGTPFKSVGVYSHCRTASSAA